MGSSNWTSKHWIEWLNTLATTREQTGTIDPHPDTLRRAAAHIEQLQSDRGGNE
ncbi:hypothetical protein LCGC14_3054720 [marine sediment metagenome]|uniref:Uncharacterized protein n=1 Tax=marine sediment metagenome TaxID=412755 RepID=A0A0F8ZBK5_9ZZZZ